VGEDPASEVYVRNKDKAANEVGITAQTVKLPATTTQAELLAEIDRLNKDKNVHGILVQLPLPNGLDDKEVINAIAPEKDVDGFHVINVGRAATGQKSALVPCTPYGCVLLLKDVLGDLSGLNAVVIGRSNIVGKPMANLLLNENCTVTIAHSRSKNLPEICAQADILVAAVGRAKMVKADWVKQGAVVIDVGINRGEDGKLVGDVDFADVAPKCKAITPVPGGVGPMTIACLLGNTLKAAKNSN
jgi:methylenetetrahydrofolate dehydrogenase (NADP+)/methenyltetrahydrofolate cyclohydrolase